MSETSSGYRYFEDFLEGEKIELGSVEVSKEGIVAFAREFDPQPFHLSEAAGSASILKGLAASGWHVCALVMRVMCDGMLLNSSSNGSPGIDYVKWRLPVYPGDRLSVVASVLNARPLKSRPEMGIVQFHISVTKQTGEPVMEMEHPILFGACNGSRPTAGAARPAG